MICNPVIAGGNVAPPSANPKWKEVSEIEFWDYPYQVLCVQQKSNHDLAAIIPLWVAAEYSTNDYFKFMVGDDRNIYGVVVEGEPGNSYIISSIYKYSFGTEITIEEFYSEFDFRYIVLET